MDYISQPPTHCSQGNLEFFLKCNKFPEKQANGYKFETNSSSNKKGYMKLGDSFPKKGEE